MGGDKGEVFQSTGEEFEGLDGDGGDGNGMGSPNPRGEGELHLALPPLATGE